MLLIIILIIVGILMLIAELVLLPGLSVAGFCALAAYGGAIYTAFNRFGATTGIIVTVIVVVLSIVAVIVSLKANTWKKFELKHSIDSTSQELPEEKNIKIGDRGTAITRLAPIGKVVIDGETYEAKAIDAYIDERSEVEVVGFENFSIIVTKVNK